MIKLIASDIDGTLLPDPKKGLDPHLFDQIITLKEHGIRFVASSGRQLMNLQNLFAPVKDDISYIAENGSLCVHNDEVISKSIIKRPLADKIVSAVMEKPNCNCIVSGETICYTTSTNDEFVHDLTEVMKNNVKFIKDFRTDIDEPILKIAICDYYNPEKTFDYFSSLFSDEIKVVTSGYAWTDFIAPNTNKGVALSKLTSELGIKPDECVAFGDQYNDVEMIEYVGTGYVMSNAAPGMSYYSTYITDSVIDVLDDIIASLEIL
ncbi:MAG: Cof-type HAD-IIB family hydrolase [Suipraeoptans sp.]